MDCKKVYKHIRENLIEDPKSSACIEIKKHREVCPNCKAYLGSLKKTVVLYKEFNVPPLKLSGGKKLKFSKNPPIRLKKNKEP
jgi:hypothetical protein